MSATTPGPWFVERGAATARRQVAELVDGHTGHARWCIVHDGERDGDAAADARLIATAPELLDVARALASHANVNPNRIRDDGAALDRTIRKAVDALAKAEGR